MESKKLLSRGIALLVLVGILLLLGGAAVAGEEFKGCKRDQVFYSALDEMVKEGVISQIKSKEVKDYVKAKVMDWKKRHEEIKKLSPEERRLLKDKMRSEGKKQGICLNDQLVQDKILTKEQADIFKTKLRDKMWQHKQQRISDKLKALVDKGILTQEQSNKVLTEIEKARTERIALFKKAEQLKPEERHQFFVENKEKFKSPVDQLLEDGVIDENQAKAIKETLPHFKAQKRCNR